ncbi:MAG: DUF4363 family protein [Clostridia bacterium]|nr:DUF4363 family protein [Clostridia bacterium]
MKRIIIAISAILGAFIISFSGFFSVDNACKKLESHLLNICSVAQQQNTEKATDLSNSAVSMWEDVHGLIESFIRHEETDKLEELIKSLPVYAQQGNMERLEQQADLAIDELHHLIRSEKPIISNIF